MGSPERAHVPSVDVLVNFRVARDTPKIVMPVPILSVIAGSEKLVGLY